MKRLDIVLVQQGLAPSREQAQQLIKNGQVSLDGKPLKKPSLQVEEEAKLLLTGETLPFVSRGGLKLQRALERFPLTLENRVCADIGASTGGFTDCMLQHGARLVYAIDVGTGQLHEKLRADSRVVNMENVNIRSLSADSLPAAPDFASVDVSFISLSHVLPVMREILADGAQAVVLVKPQFEAGRGNVGKKGVVKDPKIHLQVLRSVARYALENGFGVLQAEYSPIKGPEGNIEYLYLLQKGGSTAPDDEQLRQLVAAAHQALKE
jgi:23S rRNA (cytidine1920-2'-O)/16S rRNA (cytidine1409-2'-O)-methyltransferase